MKSQIDSICVCHKLDLLSICFSLDGGENNTQQGITHTVLGFLYFIREPDNTLYWTVFTDEERKINPVKKPVRFGEYSFYSFFQFFCHFFIINKCLFPSLRFNLDLVENIDNELHFENEHTRYAIRMNETAAQLGVKAYATE